MLNDLMEETMLFLYCSIGVLPWHSWSHVAPPETSCRNRLGWFRSWLVLIILVMQVTASPCRTCSFSRNAPVFVAFDRDRCSVLSLYTRQLADLIDKFCIDYHFFANDSELYSCLPTEPESALSALRNFESCCRQIQIWMTNNKLKLNERKTEAGTPLWTII